MKTSTRMILIIIFLAGLLVAIQWAKQIYSSLSDASLDINIQTTEPFPDSDKERSAALAKASTIIAQGTEVLNMASDGFEESPDRFRYEALLIMYEHQSIIAYDLCVFPELSDVCADSTAALQRATKLLQPENYPQ
jgi:hypothetical protein